MLRNERLDITSVPVSWLSPAAWPCVALFISLQKTFLHHQRGLSKYKAFQDNELSTFKHSKAVEASKVISLCWKDSILHWWIWTFYFFIQQNCNKLRWNCTLSRIPANFTVLFPVKTGKSYTLQRLKLLTRNIIFSGTPSLK